MTYGNRNAVVGLVTTLIVNSYMIYRLIQMSAEGVFDGPDAVMHWARMVIWVIVVAIAATIIGTILIEIVFGAIGDDDSGQMMDERDRLFEMRSVAAITFVVAIGFVATIIALAFGASALMGFNIVYFSFALGSLFSDVVKIGSYRLGG